MKEKEFIIAEVKKHLRASARKNKYQVIDAVQKMPTFEGFIFSYYSQRLDGTQFPVDVEDMYINCDEWDEFYNLTVVQVAERILQGKKYKDA